MACGAGTGQFDAEKYLREREAFGTMIMGWRSTLTIDIYDQSREGEAIFAVLAGYQQDLSQRRYGIELPQAEEHLSQKGNAAVKPQPERLPNQEAAIVWMHDAETLDWIKGMEQQTRQQ